MGKDAVMRTVGRLKILAAEIDDLIAEHPEFSGRRRGFWESAFDDINESHTRKQKLENANRRIHANIHEARGLTENAVAALKEYGIAAEGSALDLLNGGHENAASCSRAIHEVAGFLRSKVYEL